MTSPSTNFTNREIASQRKPVEAYHFYTDDGDVHYYYTSHDAPFVFNGATYNPAYISRGENEKDADLEVSKLTITVARINDAVREDLNARQAQRIWVEVYKLHKEDLDEATVVFIGQLKGTIFDGTNVQIECVGLEYFLSQTIPKDRYIPSCNNSLFDSRCAVPASTYAILATITNFAADGTTITVAHAATTVADGYLNLGFIKTYDGHRRMIVSNAAGTITLRFPLATISTQTQVTLYPGCDRTLETCSSKYNNPENFFGFPFMPLDNPALWS